MLRKLDWKAAGLGPIEPVLPELGRALGSMPSAVLAAPPGSGKTTGVPLALLDAPWLQGRTILMLEPRRLAARAAAARMADLLGERVGETVGYRIRFDSRVSARTRIEVVTEGILTRRLQNQPELPGVGLVIFDEFHERSLHADLGLALCLDVMDALRDDLRLLVMSATLDSAAVAKLLGGARVIQGIGRSYPVEVHYLPPDPRQSIADAALSGIREALTRQPGDILVFLPGGGEIREVARALEALGATDSPACGAVVHPLYGDLGREAQDLAIRPDPKGRRRVVLATPIAETSLTIEGIHTVVDSGWSRAPRFDPNSGLTRLQTVRISKASADQRSGRAGRLGPGVCYRLWDAGTQGALQPQAPAEITRTDLTPLAMELALWGVADPTSLRWLDPPPAGAYAQAQDLLTQLGALDAKGRITAAGRRMAGLAVHPRLAQLLLQGPPGQLPPSPGTAQVACDLAALLSERDILKAGRDRPADIVERLRALTAFRRGGKSAAVQAGADPGACRRVDQAARQLAQQLARQAKQRNATPAGPREQQGNAPGPSAGAHLEQAGVLLALAYPDRIAQRRPGSDDGYRLANGRGARLPPGDLLGAEEFLVAAQLDAGHSNGRIYLAAAIQREALREVQAGRIEQSASTRWDPRSESVLARQEERLGSLVLDSRPLDQPQPEAARTAMLEGIRRLGLEALPWNSAARDLQARVCSLRHWQPEEQWPDLSDAALLADLNGWLGPYLDGITRRTHLQRLDLADILRARLDWARQQRLDRDAPTHLQVPSGSRLHLQYTPGQAPVLAVRLQEMFGLADTPRVAGGRIAVVLHLLSPARRPIQVTRDLRSFWERTYPEVKKELKGRYPKHHWPDDPWSATATARAKPRRRR